MASSKEHFWGAVLFVGGLRLYNELKLHPGQLNIDMLLRAAKSGLIGGVGGLLPDVLEPATHPNHRATFHSITAGTALLLINTRVQASPNIHTNTKQAWQDLFLGYGTHLIQDHQTPKALPLI